jgi:type IV secretory pathway VirB2 component (pilin)
MSGMLTLFAVSNIEGWPDVMYAYGDATGVETGPKPGASILNNYFFVFFVFVGSFFFLNLFVGVLFLSFEKAQKDEKEAMLLDIDEIQWVDMMKMILQERPEIIKIPSNPIRKFCYKIVDEESPFSNLIMACIILNIFTMAATFEGQSDAYSSVLEKINYMFTGAFAIECALKLIAHGWNYFGSAWNKFDFFVVSASFLDIIMANMSANSLKVIRVGPQLARIMRVMRVSRLFKLLNKFKGLQALIQTITFSMPSVINAFALLALVYFIFSVLAVFFFKDITSGSEIDDYMNFSNFTMSLMMMLRLSTGEDWPTVMFDCMNTEDDCIPGSTCGTAWAPLFFLIFVVIQQYIMVNLFILIILQQFDLYYLPDDNVLDRFKADVSNFK